VLLPASSYYRIDAALNEDPDLEEAFTGKAMTMSQFAFLAVGATGGVVVLALQFDLPIIALIAASMALVLLTSAKNHRGLWKSSAVVTEKARSR
jgi:hypothetical protein